MLASSLLMKSEARSSVEHGQNSGMLKDNRKGGNSKEGEYGE